MSSISTNKKYKRPKQKTQSTTKPESSKKSDKINEEKKSSDTPCPLAAKDSEWVDILQTSASESVTSAIAADEEEVLQLVDCEDGPQMKPLAIMFPGLLEKDPNTLEGVLNKVMSTTEVTRHLVDLGQKANFTFMKKADRLIPRDKQWLERLTESSNSYTSMTSALFTISVSSDYDADNEVTSAVSDKDKIHNAKKTAEQKEDAGSYSETMNKSSEDVLSNAEQSITAFNEVLAAAKCKNETLPQTESKSDRKDHEKDIA